MFFSGGAGDIFFLIYLFVLVAVWQRPLCDVMVCVGYATASESQLTTSKQEICQYFHQQVCQYRQLEINHYVHSIEQYCNMRLVAEAGYK